MTAHNCVRYTALAIASLREFYDRVPIIVVDHGSNDETETYLRRLEKLRRVTHIRWDGPRNLAHSWNLGVRACKTQFCIVSNNDVCFTEGSVQSLVTAVADDQIGVALPADNNLAAGANGHRNLPWKIAARFCESVESFDPSSSALANDLIAQLNGWRKAQNMSQKLTYLHEPYYPVGGFCFAIDKKKHEIIGDFDESYTYYGEDWDYFSRNQRHFKMVRADNAFVWHFEKRTSKATMHSDERFDAVMSARFKLIEDHEGKREIVSIVIPVFNRTEELRVALASVIGQSFVEWRAYVINDGSSNRDAIAAVCNSFKDPRIGLWDLPQNQGPSAARNYGIQRARGKYIALLDSDDIWLPNHLREHLRIHEFQYVDVTYSDPKFKWRWWNFEAKEFDELEDTIPTVVYHGEFDRNVLLQRNFIITSSTVWWANTLKAHMFDESMRFEEDWDLCKRAATDSRFMKVRGATCWYCQQPGTNGLMEQNNAVITPPARVMQSRVVVKSPITVVVPTIGEDTLDRTINSLGSRCPIIIVVDHSSDIIFNNIKRLYERHSNVTVLRCRGLGASTARNVGWRAAKTEWVKFIDADDFTTDAWLIAHERYCSVEVDLFTVDCVMPYNNDVNIIGSDGFCTSQLTCRVSALHAIGGFNEGSNWQEEQEMVSRMEEYPLRRVHHSGVTIIKSGVSRMKQRQPTASRMSNGDYI